MNRRKFLGTLVGGVATAAAVRTWPFRVFSFPKAPTRFDMLNLDYWPGKILTGAELNAEYFGLMVGVDPAIFSYGFKITPHAKITGIRVEATRRNSS